MQGLAMAHISNHKGRNFVEFVGGERNFLHLEAVSIQR